MKSFRAAFLLISLEFLAGSVAAEDKMILATLRSVSQACFWVALESGFYKEFGLEVLPVNFSGGT
jgi:ABC-type nitrate/sulfonate/bicarbonate transport system substrate-binding protein